MENPTIISKEKDRFGKIFLTAVGIDENDPKALPLSDHIKELKRELRLREVAYGKQVEEKPNDAKRLRYQYRLLRRQLWFLLKLEQFNIKSL